MNITVKYPINLEVPENIQDGINKVKVVFLDAQLERVDDPYQKLGDAQVTTGFFSMHETLSCWWSEDHKQRADGTTMQVIKSVNSGLLPVGNESFEQKDDFHGEIEVQISKWVPILATVMALADVAAAFIPDATESTSKGFTLPTVLSALGEIMLFSSPTGGPVTGVITMLPISVVAEEVLIPGPAWTAPRVYAQNSPKELADQEWQKLQQQRQEQWRELEEEDKCRGDTGQRLQEAETRRRDAEKRQRDTGRRLRELQK